MIAVVNYGLGNIQAFINIYNRLNIAATAANTAEELAQAEKIILPGVGAFDRAMTRLNESGMRECLDDLVLKKKIPVLGVCVGMQMMAHTSEEGILAGLGWIDSEVKKFDATSFTQKTHLPHMGWNDVSPNKTGCLFKDLDITPCFYFLHSYYFLPRRAEEILAVTEYGCTFASATCSRNIYGVQFHPEKSHHWGIKLLKNFAEL